jgi:AcrR family transcriptional regulator
MSSLSRSTTKTLPSGSTSPSPTSRADTRARILDTAWTLVRERRIDAVTLAEIAAATGVSRQLLYVHFGNRAGLLVAMTRRQDVRSGFAARVAEVAWLPAAAALERLLRLWFGYIPQVLPVARALEAAAINGDEGGLAWRDRMDDLREAFRAAVDRVHLDGRLADGWMVEAATDWVWAGASPRTGSTWSGIGAGRPRSTRTVPSARSWPRS